MPTYIEAIQEVSVVEKPMSEEELEDNNKQVEKLTGDETTEVNVVPDDDINLDFKSKCHCFYKLLPKAVLLTCYEYS